MTFSEFVQKCTAILKKKKGGLEVSDRDLPSHLSQTDNLPSWNDIDEVDRDEVEIKKLALQDRLQKLFGDNIEAKMAWMKNLRQQVKNGYVRLTQVEAVALNEVLFHEFVKEATAILKKKKRDSCGQ